MLIFVSLRKLPCQIPWRQELQTVQGTARTVRVPRPTVRSAPGLIQPSGRGGWQVSAQPESAQGLCTLLRAAVGNLELVLRARAQRRSPQAIFEGAEAKPSSTRC